MTHVLELTALPAREGDALWVRWGDASHPHQLLIDMGTESTGKVIRDRIERLPVDQREFDLLVVTHVDADHIGGTLTCLAEGNPLPGLEIDDVWFNGFRHLPAAESTRGAAQGERLTDLLRARRLPWNAAFHGDAVVVPAEGALPRVTCSASNSSRAAPIPR